MLHPYTRARRRLREVLRFRGQHRLRRRPHRAGARGLKSKKDLQTVVLLIVMYRITREMYFSATARRS